MKVKYSKYFSKIPKRIVVKVGSNGVCDGAGLRRSVIASLAADIHHLLEHDHEVILVSSGAIHVGRQEAKLPDSIEMDVLQALSAIGQPLLMAAYQDAFRQLSRVCAQVLLTHEDLGHRQRNLNQRNTFLRLLSAKAIPIVNENDSVSYAEITVGDNDQLAAMLAQSLNADALILLTEPTGLFDRPPNEPGAQKIDQIHPDDEFSTISTKGQSTAGRGGMKTKVAAVRRITPLGIPAIISSFANPSPILAALEGAGTFFHAEPDTRLAARYRWLLSSAKAGAKIRIDQGAFEALSKGASLLPRGIRSLIGPFRRGDCVALTFRNRIVAHGLTEYSFRELEKIRGHKSDEIKAILGSLPSKVVIHRNNLVMTTKGKK